jgi:hypothetical protein
MELRTEPDLRSEIIGKVEVDSVSAVLEPPRERDSEDEIPTDVDKSKEASFLGRSENAREQVNNLLSYVKALASDPTVLSELGSLSLEQYKRLQNKPPIIKGVGVAAPFFWLMEETGVLGDIDFSQSSTETVPAKRAKVAFQFIADKIQGLSDEDFFGVSLTELQTAQQRNSELYATLHERKIEGAQTILLAILGNKTVELQRFLQAAASSESTT